MQTIRLAVGSLILLIALAGASRAEDQKFSCKGQMIQQMAKPGLQQKAQIDLNATLGDNGKMSIKIGDGKTTDARVTSNNDFKFQFEGDEFTGEYFHYSGDLFIMYKSGPLARLQCSRI
jgi:hypothetical protein